MWNFVVYFIDFSFSHKKFSKRDKTICELILIKLKENSVYFKYTRKTDQHKVLTGLSICHIYYLVHWYFLIFSNKLNSDFIVLTLKICVFYCLVDAYKEIKEGI